MKTFYIHVVFLFLSIHAFAQISRQSQESGVILNTNDIERGGGQVTINGIPIKDIDVEYAQIVGFSRLLSSKISVRLDFGQERTLFGSRRATQLIDENGNPINFTSMIDALNFMHQQGYEFVQAYAETINDEHVTHYLLRKKKV